MLKAAIPVRIPTALPRQYLRSRLTPSIRTFTTRQQGPIRCQLNRWPTRPSPRSHAFTQPRRSIGFYQRVQERYREAGKDILRKHPILFPVALLSAIGGLAALAYILYVQIYKVNPQYHNYPEEVAVHLRKAVYYTNLSPAPPKALKSYKDALEAAKEAGMHPYSDEVMGIKLNISMMLEEAGLIKPAIDVLESLMKESQSWVEDSRRKKTLRDEERAKAGPPTPATKDDLEAVEAEQKRIEHEAMEERMRTRTLKRIVGMALKLGELYSGDYIQDEAKAEEMLHHAVNTALKEFGRRQTLGLPKATPEGDDSWLTLGEVASALEQLGAQCASKENYEFATTLYMNALSMIKEEEGKATTCKQVVLLNNVSMAMAGQAQKPTPPSQVAQSQPGRQVSREQLVDAAEKWASKTLEVAAHVPPPVRTEDCDLTCVVALCNLGELAEMAKKPQDAKQKYQQAKDLAQAIGFEDGIQQANEALQRLASK